MGFVRRYIKCILYVLCPRGGGARRGKRKTVCDEKNKNNIIKYCFGPAPSDDPSRQVSKLLIFF